MKFIGIFPLCEDVCHQVGFGPESWRRSFRPELCCIMLKVARLPRPAFFLFGSVWVCVCAFPFWWVCESTDVIVRLCSALEWLVGRLDCQHVHAIRLFVLCEASNVVFDVTWLVCIPALEREDLCHQVVYSPWCVWHFGQWRKSFACRVDRYLLRMLVVFVWVIAFIDLCHCWIRSAFEWIVLPTWLRTC